MVGLSNASSRENLFTLMKLARHARALRTTPTKAESDGGHANINGLDNAD